MKKILTSLLLSLATAGYVFAQDISIQLAQGDGKKKSEYSAGVGGTSLLRVSVQNISSVPITVEYVGIGSGAALVKVPQRTIEPTYEAFFPILVDNDSLGVAANMEVGIGYVASKQLKLERSVVTLGASDIVSFSPGYLSWKVGEPAKEKMAVVALPKNTRAGKLPAVEGFSLRLEGNKLYATPLSTEKPVVTAFFLKTTPSVRANRLVPLGLTITP